LDNEFDHIFREAGQAYQVKAPSSVWRNIRYELDAARGYRLLQWIWPMRLAVGVLVLGSSLVSVIQSYDSLQISQSEPIDYDKVALELGISLPESSPESNTTLSSAIETDKQPEQSFILKSSSTDIVQDAINTTDNTQPYEAHSVESETPSEPEERMIAQNKAGEALISNYEEPLSVTSLSSFQTNSLPTNSLEVPVMDYSFVDESFEVKKIPTSRWYIQIGYLMGDWNNEFNTDAILTLYQQDDPTKKYIPTSAPTFVQKTNDAWLVKFEAGYRISEHLAVESGAQVTYLSGSQRTILTVEEQTRYTFNRQLPVPAGFNDEKVVTIEEEVIDSRVLRDTLSSSFSYQSVAVPLKLIYSQRWNKIGVFGGPSFTLELGNQIRTSSRSSLYPELNRTEVVYNRFTTTEMRLGLSTGAQYYVGKQFSFLAEGMFHHHVPSKKNTISLENYQSWQLGLGVRYEF